MPRITIDYDSDSSFERNHLELSTHQQILARYISVRDDKKLPPKEKVMKLEHASEKTFLALKRVCLLHLITFFLTSPLRKRQVLTIV